LANKINRLGWLGKILLWTFFLSIFFNTISQSLLKELGLFGSLLVLMVIIATGVIFDTIGVAATAASLPPLNARAAKRVSGAKQALNLARNSDQVASFCNDVIGDISGIISGSAGAAIMFNIAVQSINLRYYNVLMMAAVATLTVGGKGIGKSFAISYSTEILMMAGKVIFFFNKFIPGSKPNGRSNRK